MSNTWIEISSNAADEIKRRDEEIESLRVEWASERNHVAGLRAEIAQLREERDDAVEQIARTRENADYHKSQVCMEIQNEIFKQRDEVLVENARLREALEKIATQKKTNELVTAYDVEIADFEDGYDMSIDVARAALAEKEEK